MVSLINEQRKNVIHIINSTWEVYGMAKFYDRNSFELENNIVYNNDGYFVFGKKEGFLSKFKKKTDKLVTVITPVYNAEDNLKKTIDSVINQTINFKNVEYILVDDGSKDNSRPILLDYAKKYPESIKVVFLEKNSGTPGHPRNMGIELSTSPYITFLDADDWLEEDGLATLYNILKETNDDYVVGKTIQVETKSTKIVGEHESCMERRSVSTTSIPHIFQHLGPRARMVKSSLLKENNIKYPEMKFAEDKQFFIDVLVHAKAISTTTKTIYYLNRLDDNDASLTKQTDIMHKTDTNIKVIKYVKAKNLDVHLEKMILNRLYEFDCITRFFNRQHFFKSKNKQAYYNKFAEVVETTKDLKYDITDQFFHPINKVVYQMYLDGKYDLIAKLFMWDKSQKVKDLIVKEDLPYMITPIEGHEHIRVSMASFFQDGSFQEDGYHFKFHIYGDYMDQINDLVFRDRGNTDNQFTFTITNIDNFLYEAVIPNSALIQLSKGSYAIFIRYNDYQKININRIDPHQKKIDKQSFHFYTTINSNLGLSVGK